MPVRQFCTAGPVDRKQHFYVDKTEEVAFYVEAVRNRKYMIFKSHSLAGKTTLLNQISKKLIEEGFRVYLLPISEGLDLDDVEAFYDRILSFLGVKRTDRVNLASADLYNVFVNGKEKSVLLIDEFNRLIYNKHASAFLSLLHSISVLGKKGAASLYSVIGCGLDDVRELANPQAASPFHMDGLHTLPHFTKKEMDSLFAQFEAERNVALDNCVKTEIFEFTHGFPALVCVCGDLIDKWVRKGQRVETTFVSKRDWLSMRARSWDALLKGTNFTWANMTYFLSAPTDEAVLCRQYLLRHFDKMTFPPPGNASEIRAVEFLLCKGWLVPVGVCMPVKSKLLPSSASVSDESYHWACPLYRRLWMQIQTDIEFNEHTGQVDKSLICYNPKSRGLDLMQLLEMALPCFSFTTLGESFAHGDDDSLREYALQFQLFSAILAVLRKSSGDFRVHSDVHCTIDSETKEVINKGVEILIMDNSKRYGLELGSAMSQRELKARVDQSVEYATALDLELTLVLNFLRRRPDTAEDLDYFHNTDKNVEVVHIYLDINNRTFTIWPAKGAVDLGSKVKFGRGLEQAGLTLTPLKLSDEEDASHSLITYELQKQPHLTRTDDERKLLAEAFSPIVRILKALPVHLQEEYFRLNPHDLQYK